VRHAAVGIGTRGRTGCEGRSGLDGHGEDVHQGVIGDERGVEPVHHDIHLDVLREDIHRQELVHSPANDSPVPDSAGDEILSILPTSDADHALDVEEPHQVADLRVHVLDPVNQLRCLEAGTHALNGDLVEAPTAERRIEIQVALFLRGDVDASHAVFGDEMSSESLRARRLEVPHPCDQLHSSLLIALPLSVAV
jgi:hypothetical protein